MLKRSKLALAVAGMTTLMLGQVAFGQLSGSYFVNSGEFQVFTGAAPSEPVDGVLIDGPAPVNGEIDWVDSYGGGSTPIGGATPDASNALWDVTYHQGTQSYINEGGVTTGNGSPPAACGAGCATEVAGAFIVADYGLGLVAADFGEISYGGWADGTIRTTSVNLSLAGDYNGDGFVGAGDLALVLTNWGQTEAAPAGWVNHFPSGLISSGELNGVLNNWGDDISSFPTSAPLSVPEPSSAMIVLLSLGALALRRR